MSGLSLLHGFDVFPLNKYGTTRMKKERANLPYLHLFLNSACAETEMEVISVLTISVLLRLDDVIGFRHVITFRLMMTFK